MVLEAFTRQCITKTYLYNSDPLKPHFYILKLGFTWVYIIVLISTQKHKLWYSLEPPQWGGSNEYVPTIYVLSKNMKNIRIFYLKFSFFSVFLNKHVFIMGSGVVSSLCGNAATRCGAFCVLSYSLPCVLWILFTIVTIFLGCLACLCIVSCVLSVLVCLLPLGVIGTLYSLTVSLPGHLL